VSIPVIVLSTRPELALSRWSPRSPHHSSYRTYYGPNVVLDVINGPAEAAAA
jgi:hypothetical protein